MEFIKNNWWYFLVVGTFGFMMLRKGGIGCCNGHSNNNNSTSDHQVHEDKVDSNISKTAKDPVCGMEVDTASALIVTKYGRTYYFCSKSCKREFMES